MPSSCVALVGTFNTKGAELSCIQKQLEKNGLEVILVDVSCLEYEQSEQADFTPQNVAAAAGLDFKDIARLPLYKASVDVSRGAYSILSRLIKDKAIQGCIGIGGGNGTAIAAKTMEKLPLGFPKVIISVLAAVDARWLFSHTDIVLFNAIGDAVLNPVLEVVIERAARALSGMAVNVELPILPEMVGLTVLGVTDKCVEGCRDLLGEMGYPSFLLHSNGPGGATLERTIKQDYYWGILDITTNELINNLMGCEFDAGPHRLLAAIEKKIPLVISTGAIDFVNFWGTRVPETFRDRLFLRHSMQNTLMRTDAEENAQLGKSIAEKLNKAQSPVRVIVPRKGFSKYDRVDGIMGTDLDGNAKAPWFSPEAVEAFIVSLNETLDNPLVKVQVKDYHINDREFSKELVAALMEISGR